MSASTRVLRWEEPPPPLARAGGRREGGPGSGKYATLAVELRTRPGVWAVVYEGSVGGASAVTTHIRYGQLAAFTPPGDFDATSRTHDGVLTVYARYVGDGDR